MSPVRRPSSVQGLRRGVAAPQVREDDTIGRPEDIGRLSGKRVSEMTTPEIQALAAPGRRPRPERPVRFTLDLDRERHSYLKQTATAIEADASALMRALLDEMRADPELETRIRARVWGA